MIIRRQNKNDKLFRDNAPHSHTHIRSFDAILNLPLSRVITFVVRTLIKFTQILFLFFVDSLRFANDKRTFLCSLYAREEKRRAHTFIVNYSSRNDYFMSSACARIWPNELLPIAFIAMNMCNKMINADKTIFCRIVHAQQTHFIALFSLFILSFARIVNSRWFDLANYLFFTPCMVVFH